MVVALYTSRVILHSLGQTDFGIFNVVGGVVAMASFINSSLISGFQRFFNIALGKNDLKGFRELFSTSITIELFLSVAILLLLETIGLWFVNTYLVFPEDRTIAANVIFQTTSFVFIINMFISPFSAVLISYERMDIYAFISIGQTVAKLIIAICLSLASVDRLILYGILLLIVDVFFLLFYIFFAKKISGFLKLKPIIIKDKIVSMLNFSGWNLLGAFAFVMKGQGLNIVLNLFFGPVVNAARGIAYQVSGAVSSFYQNFQMAVRPQIMKSYAVNDLGQMINLVYMMSKISFYLMWVLSLPLLFSMDFIMSLWLGNGYPPLASLFARIVLATCLVECLGNPISTIVHATGKMKVFQIVCSIVILLIVPIAYFVLWLGAEPQYALYVSFIMAFVTQFVRLILIEKIIDFSITDYFKNVITPILVVVSTTIIFPFLLNKCSLHPVINMSLIFMIASLSVYFFGLSQGEKKFIKNKLKFSSKLKK